MPRAFVRAWIWVCLCIALPGASEGPVLLERDVISAADHSSGRVAPGEIVLLYPSNAGPEVLAGTYAGADGKVLTLLGQTRVLFDGIAAPMSFSVRGQLGAVVPYEVANKKTTEVVVEYQGVRSPAVRLAVVNSAPAVFTLDLSGSGQAAILNDTGCCNSARNPATRGSIAVLYATGEGQTRPLGISGNVSVHARIADYPVPQLPVQVWVGGERAEIAYAGEAPHAVAGLLQVNFRVPARVPVSDAVPIVLWVGDTRSQDGVTMAVRSSVKQILVIDRQPAARNWLARVLAHAGYEVFTAENDAEALRQADEHPIDLVIVSIQAGEDKLAAVQALRAERPQLRVVAVAGKIGPATLRTVDLLGAQAVLTKPMDRGSVLRRVRGVLQIRPVSYAR
jgi:uncharacterized protein (TIGR03437 family)